MTSLQNVALDVSEERSRYAQMSLNLGEYTRSRTLGCLPALGTYVSAVTAAHPKSAASFTLRSPSSLRLYTPNLPIESIPTMIRWLNTSRTFPMDMKCSPLKLEIPLESKPLKSGILLRRLGVEPFSRLRSKCSNPCPTNWPWSVRAACFAAPRCLCTTTVLDTRITRCKQLGNQSGARFV